MRWQIFLGPEEGSCPSQSDTAMARSTDANELVADVHDRMPLILPPVAYARWLGEEPDPRDLMRPLSLRYGWLQTFAAQNHSYSTSTQEGHDRRAWWRGGHFGTRAAGWRSWLVVRAAGNASDR